LRISGSQVEKRQNLDVFARLLDIGDPPVSDSFGHEFGTARTRQNVDWLAQQADVGLRAAAKIVVLLCRLA